MSPRPGKPAAAAAPAPAAVSVGFISLGCAKNLVDSQLMAGSLADEGLDLAAAPEQADVVIVNTCAFIEEARAESVEVILDACRLKDRGPCRAVLVAGCLTQRYREELRASLPEVDGFLGVDELDRVGEVARRVAEGERGMLYVSDRPRRLFDPGRTAVVFTGGPYAYLKIAEGCDHPCAFCAIPGIRGRYRSRTMDAVEREAERLLTQGCRELNLVSQDTTFYGRDLGDGSSLAALLERLDRLGGRFWVRVLYGYPSRLTDELLATIAGASHLCAYLDVPIQHSHPDVLRAMRREDTAESVSTLPERVRRTLPGAVLRTTCLVGFPGETPAHSRHLQDYLRAGRFDHVGVFAFSPEEGTPAAALPGRPRRTTAERRRARLLAVQKEIVESRARELAGSETEAILERPARTGGGRAWIGRTPRQAPEVDGHTVVGGVPENARTGDFVKARYTGGRDYDLRAAALP